MGKLQNWMSHLDDNRKLVDLCLPGSHDSGVYRDNHNGIKPCPKAGNCSMDFISLSTLPLLLANAGLDVDLNEKMVTVKLGDCVFEPQKNFSEGSDSFPRLN
jgi:hypothetical protein